MPGQSLAWNHKHKEHGTKCSQSSLFQLFLLSSLFHRCSSQEPSSTRADVASAWSVFKTSSFKFPVCWTSTENGGYPPLNSRQPVYGIPGVAVYGSGCSHCAVGATCSFSVSVAVPASWIAPVTHPQWREIKVMFKGPALHAGLIESTDPEDNGFLVSYRIWDAGTYRVSLHSPCGTLNYTDNPAQNRPHVMASWNLTVHSPADVISFPQQDPKPSPDVTAALSNIPLPNGLVSPCAVGKYGRWLKQADDSYDWTAFNCLQTVEMNPENWALALNKRGIFEISFVGDSHQRNLMLHMRSLLTGGELDEKHKSLHTHFNYTIGEEGKGLINLRFFWMSGVYVSEDQFGCKFKKRPEYPVIPPTSDVVIIEGGYWTGMQCTHPEAALATHFSAFLLWAQRQIDAAAKNETRLEQGGREHPLLVYRPTPPRASEGSGCTRKLTNKYVQDANAIEKVLVPLFGAHEFDSWEIEAAGPREDCEPFSQEHFSCFVKEAEENRHKVVGKIGQADVLSLVHLMLNN